MLKIEIQHFEGCPNSAEMIARVKATIKECKNQIDYKEIFVETTEKAERIKFRGSPTILINGIDLKNMPEPKGGNLACRYYKNGLPTVEQIKAFIYNQLKKKEKI